MKRNMFLIAVALVLLFLQSTFAQTEELPDTVWTKFTYPAAVNAVKFTPDGKYLVSGGSDGIPKLWDAETGELVREFLGNETPIFSLDINNTGELLAGVNGSSIITIWNVQTGEIVKVIDQYEGQNTFRRQGLSIEFSHNGNYLAAMLMHDGTSYPERDIFLLNTNDWHVESQRKDLPVTSSLTFSPDDTKLALSNYVIGESQITVGILEVPNLMIFHILDGASNHGNEQTAFSPDGKYLAGAISGGPNKIWNTSDWKLFKEFGENSYSVAYSKDNQFIVIGGGQPTDRHVYVRNAQTGELIYTYPKSNVPNSIDISPNNKLIAASLMTSGIIVYNAKWNPTSVQENPVHIIEPLVYPNPTNSTANIRFDLLNSSSISIQIYDINSRLITLVFDGFLESGNHNYEWNSAQAASGTYFARITANGEVSSIQIIVNK